MDFPESYYYKLNFILMTMVGQSPNQSVFCRLVILGSFGIYFTVLTYLQIAKLIEDRFVLRVIVDCGPATVTTFGIVISTPIVYRNVRTVEHLYLRMRNDWLEFRTAEENKIKHSYAQFSRLFTKYFTMYLYSGAVIITSAAFIPNFLDFVVPLNESRPHVSVFHAKFMFDEQKYFYHITFATYIAASIILITIASHESMFAVFVTHVCGMFKVIGYRLENMLHIVEYKEGNMDDYKIAIINHLNSCMKKHQEALEFATILENGYSSSVFILLVVCFLSLSISLVECTTSDLISSRSVPYSIGQMAVFFVLTIMGQKLIDISTSVSQNAYNGRWFDCPIQVQKIFLLVTLRSTKPCTLSALKVHILCVENFALVLQTALSYCMVLRQLQ